MRLFIALPCPPEVRETLAGVQTRLSSYGSFKFVLEENIHVTMKFLGEVSADSLRNITEALTPVRDEPSFTVRVQGLGVFPKPSFPRILWAGIAEGANQVDALHVRVDELLKPLGFPQDDRFHPHATIARAKKVSDTRELSRLLQENKTADYGTYQARTINLMESKLSPQGPAYTILQEFPLKRA